MRNSNEPSFGWLITFTNTVGRQMVPRSNRYLNRPQFPRDLTALK